MSARGTVPFHCPFCGEEDLRPVEDDASAWVCRSCARVFTVALLRVERGLLPGAVEPPSGAAEPMPGARPGP